tara:strand:- start:322 stop:675 length:354 start_codon:yes stop_codon:yes gene_type:complete
MGIIKRVGEMLMGAGDRLDRAGSTLGANIGYRSRSAALRSRIDNLPAPTLNLRNTAQAQTATTREKRVARALAPVAKEQQQPQSHGYPGQHKPTDTNMPYTNPNPDTQISFVSTAGG